MFGDPLIQDGLESGWKNWIGIGMVRFKYGFKIAISENKAEYPFESAPGVEVRASTGKTNDSMSLSYEILTLIWF